MRLNDFLVLFIMVAESMVMREPIFHMMLSAAPGSRGKFGKGRDMKRPRLSESAADPGLPPRAGIGGGAVPLSLGGGLRHARAPRSHKFPATRVSLLVSRCAFRRGSPRRWRARR
jgi:hypothetical protein